MSYRCGKDLHPIRDQPVDLDRKSLEEYVANISQYDPASILEIVA